MLNELGKQEIEYRDSLLATLQNRADNAHNQQIEIVPSFRLEFGHGGTFLNANDVSNDENGNLRIRGLMNDEPYTIAGDELNTIVCESLHDLIQRI